MSVEFDSLDRAPKPLVRGAASRSRAMSARREAPPAVTIHHSAEVPPVQIPPGHVGPVVLPGTGRLVYWTGRVAIGLRHQPPARSDAVPQSALWVQDLMLGSGCTAA